MKLLDADAFCVVWALQKSRPWHPLIVCSHRNLLYIFNVKTKKFIGCLRGHGAEITSIAIRPNYPNIFCSTSRDFTARVYDLMLRPQQETNNVHWPPHKEPSKAGPAFGLHMSDSEGPAHGIGRCIAVTGGQRSGGHQAAVLHAAWHQDLPVIATCGIDRCAKLWYLPPCKDGTQIRRLDQPIFTTSMLHTGRVMSIAWLGRDVLLTHCGPALVRAEEAEESVSSSDHDYEVLRGDFKIWQWLSIDRFFPPVYFQHEPPERLTVPLADYRESSSFRILASRPFVDGPDKVYEGHRSHLFALQHNWLAFHFVPGADTVQFFNPSHMDVFEVEPLSWEGQDDMVDIMAKRLRISEDQSVAGPSAHTETKAVASSGAVPTTWEVTLQASGVQKQAAAACAMGMGGQAFAVVSNLGSVWIWRRRE
ncbi:WD40-repeat-containing domain protein [Schizophyllum amplum]|uniref:WD40-repeat-containing domain protein n=1 Tax=Schizophyllum amplum TaxID=97359 RepID=A0A550C603_9AGAR|nr:WD40-repeat-containing domain protein [Auriculariopsis ampla]